MYIEMIRKREKSIDEREYLQMKIGVLSDTHIPKKARKLPKIVLEVFQGVDHSIHAGDIVNRDVIIQLEQIAPVTAVCGNVDSYELMEKLGEKRIQSFGDFKFGIFHGHGKKGKTIDRAMKCFEEDKVDCIIFGHSHIPYCKFHDDILLFNPGSPTDKRRNKHYSFGLTEIHKTMLLRIVYFDSKGVVH